MLSATVAQIASASATDSGNATPAYGTAIASVNAIAPAGAIIAIDWNATSRKPIEFARSSAVTATPC